MRAEVRGGGGPLLRVKRADLLAAGVERTDARVAGVRDGKPILDDGRVLDVANVDLVHRLRQGHLAGSTSPSPARTAGPSRRAAWSSPRPGLYFVGLPFLYAFASMLVGGVGRDAERVAEHIAARERVAAPEGRALRAA